MHQLCMLRYTEHLIRQDLVPIGWVMDDLLIECENERGCIVGASIRYHD